MLRHHYIHTVETTDAKTSLCTLVDVKTSLVVVKTSIVDLNISLVDINTSLVDVKTWANVALGSKNIYPNYFLFCLLDR